MGYICLSQFQQAVLEAMREQAVNAENGNDLLVMLEFSKVLEVKLFGGDKDGD